MLGARENDITKLQVDKEYTITHIDEVLDKTQEVFVALYGSTRKHAVRRLDAEGRACHCKS